MPTLELQEQSNWCWAACIRMTGAAFGRVVPIQCLLAEKLFGAIGCCADGTSSACNQPLDSSKVPFLYGSLGMGATSAAITPIGLQQALSATSLVLILFDLGTAYHFALLYNSNGKLAVLDPRYGSQSDLTFSQIANAYGMGQLVDAWTLTPE